MSNRRISLILCWTVDNETVYPRKCNFSRVKTTIKIWTSSWLGIFWSSEMLAIKNYQDASSRVRSLDSRKDVKIVKLLVNRGFNMLTAAPDLNSYSVRLRRNFLLSDIKSVNIHPGEIPLAQNLSNLIILASYDTVQVWSRVFGQWFHRIEEYHQNTQIVDIAYEKRTKNNRVMMVLMSDTLFCKCSRRRSPSPLGTVSKATTGPTL